MKLVFRSLIALIATMTLSGCMVMMAPMLLWHGAHLKKKKHHTEEKSGTEEVCECCKPSGQAGPQAAPMGHGDHTDGESGSVKIPANHTQ